MTESHAVVIVSGGAAVSPFTTPTQACGSGLAAGNTDTALREALLKAGHQVFTSPTPQKARSNLGRVAKEGCSLAETGHLSESKKARTRALSTGHLSESKKARTRALSKREGGRLKNAVLDSLSTARLPRHATRRISCAR